MPQIECDVLVIGGGLAGCWAAIKAAEKTPRVVLVEKGKVARSGKSSFSGAGILCPLPEDDLEAWRKEIVVKGEYLADQEMVDIILAEQFSRIKDMGEWGVDYERDDKGRLVRVSALGSAVTKTVAVSSQEMMEALRKRMSVSGVYILDRTMVTGLLTSDGLHPTRAAVAGSYGFDIASGEPFVISAAATVLATGGTGWFDLSGDGIAMGYRAGAEVWGMEFTKTMDQMGFLGKVPDMHLITFQRLGMRLYNCLGERFMERYYPEQKENVTRAQMALAVIVENLEGRGPVYADLTHLDRDGLNKLRTTPATALRVSAIEKEGGVDFGKDRVRLDVHSGFIHSETGGLRHNVYGETNLPGLYVAGEVGGFPANGTGSIPLKLASCCVEGYRAGENAARFALEMGSKPVNKEQAKLLEETTFKPLRRQEGIAPQELADKITQYLRPAMVSVYRHSKFIKLLLAEKEAWQRKASMLKAADLHELVKANKVRNYIDVIELVFRSSLEREETRGLNIRIDYPYRDNANWMKHVVLRRESSGTGVTYLPVPIYRYQVRPESYEKSPAIIPWPGFLLEDTSNSFCLDGRGNLK